jgi:HEXXH motif-containing protein
MRTVSRSELADWFLPNNVQLTESLVRLSGLNRLREFSQMSAYLVSRPDFESFRPEVLATLEQYDREPPDLLFRRLASPVFRGWLSRFGGVREYATGDEVLAAQLALWGNLRHSLAEPGDYAATLKVTNGCLMSWDPRVAVRVGGLDRVVVERDGRRLVVRTVDGKLLIDVDVDPEGTEPPRFAADGCRVLEGSRLPGSGIVVRNDLPLLHLKLSRTAQREDGVVFGDFDHSSSSYPRFEADPFLQAAATLRSAWPDEYDDFRQTLQVVVPRGAPPGWRARGMTVSSHQGAIWIFVRGSLDLVEHMVHEQSHVKLRYIEETCPILTSEQTEQRFLVGWRKDPRPIVGIYEGVYVHIHVLLALIACQQNECFSGEVADACSARIHALQDEVHEGLTILIEHGRFTDTGMAFVDWAAAVAQNARDERP